MSKRGLDGRTKSLRTAEMEVRKCLGTYRKAGLEAAERVEITIRENELEEGITLSSADDRVRLVAMNTYFDGYPRSSETAYYGGLDTDDITYYFVVLATAFTIAMRTTRVMETLQGMGSDWDGNVLPIYLRSTFDTAVHQNGEGWLEREAVHHNLHLTSTHQAIEALPALVPLHIPREFWAIRSELPSATYIERKARRLAIDYLAKSPPFALFPFASLLNLLARHHIVHLEAEHDEI